MPETRKPLADGHGARPALCCWLVLSVLFVEAAAAGEAGKLDLIREEVRGESEDRKKPPPKHEHGDSGDADSGVFGEFLGGLLWDVFLGVVSLPFWLPHEVLGDEPYNRGYFLPYPYADGKPGSMLIPTAPHVPVPPAARDRSLRVLVEDSYDMEGVNSLRCNLLLSTSQRFICEASWTCMTEQLDGGGLDRLSMLDAGLGFRFAQHEKVQMRAGLGAVLMVDEGNADRGWFFSYDGDFFPARPWVVSAGIDLGGLGNAFMFHWRLSAGALMSRYEVFAGYDSLSIGTVTIRGPMLGLRGWF